MFLEKKPFGLSWNVTDSGGKMGLRKVGASPETERVDEGPNLSARRTIMYN